MANTDRIADNLAAAGWPEIAADVREGIPLQDIRYRVEDTLTHEEADEVVAILHAVENDEPASVECDCGDNLVPGALYPWAPGGDDSLPYVERCDTCQRFANDDEAARAIAAKIGGRVAWAALAGERQVRDHVCPFILPNAI